MEEHRSEISHYFFVRDNIFTKCMIFHFAELWLECACTSFWNIPKMDGTITLLWIVRERLWGVDWIQLAESGVLWQRLLNCFEASGFINSADIFLCYCHRIKWELSVEWPVSWRKTLWNCKLVCNFLKQPVWRPRFRSMQFVSSRFVKFYGFIECNNLSWCSLF
jgi:hypothetical protein